MSLCSMCIVRTEAQTHSENAKMHALQSANCSALSMTLKQLQCRTKRYRMQQTVT